MHGSQLGPALEQLLEVALPDVANFIARTLQHHSPALGLLQQCGSSLPTSQPLLRLWIALPVAYCVKKDCVTK